MCVYVCMWGAYGSLAVRVCVCFLCECALVLGDPSMWRSATCHALCTYTHAKKTHKHTLSGRSCQHGLRTLVSGLTCVMCIHTYQNTHIHIYSLAGDVSMVGGRSWCVIAYTHTKTHTHTFSWQSMSAWIEEAR